MKLSTKGRYGLRALIDLAQNGGEQPVSITSISTRQDISERYLEQLMSMLKKAGIVRSVRGAGGGYVLVKDWKIFLWRCAAHWKAVLSRWTARVLNQMEDAVFRTVCVTNMFGRKINDSINPDGR